MEVNVNRTRDTPISKQAGCARHRTPSVQRTCLAILQLALSGAGSIRTADRRF